jgi:hypothetical protein
MSTNAGQPSEVLHSDHPTKLTAEQIAKAVAHHNKQHPAGRPSSEAKPKKAAKH